MILLLAAMSATIALTGVVPPHRANDGKVFVVSGAPGGAAEEAFRTCEVRHFAPLVGGYQFALGPDDAGRAACVAARVSPVGTVSPQARWNG